MALDQTTLTNNLKAVFDSLPSSASNAADALAKAYVDYATLGRFAASAPNFGRSPYSTFATTLLSAISVPATGTPATFAAAWATAVAARWLAVPVTGPQTGVTNGCPGAAALTAALTTVFANLENTTETCATALATALHTATLTVTATVTPPPGTVLPIA